MLYNCATEEVTKSVKESAWSLAKGITENKNSNPGPRERQTLFCSSQSCILLIPISPGILSQSLATNSLSRILSLPSHFLISNLIWFLCSSVPGTDPYWKHSSSHLYKLAGVRSRIWNPVQIPLFDNLAAHVLWVFTCFHPVGWPSDLLPLPVPFAQLWFQPDVWSPGHCCLLRGASRLDSNGGMRCR